MKTLIIAEAGVNHNGSFENAIKLIQAAAEAGADYVKFQTFKAEKIVSKEARKAEYQIKNLSNADNSQFSMLKKLEIPESWYKDLIEEAEKNKIGFLSTGFDEESVDFLENLGCPLFKIPSGELTNLPFLRHIAQKRKPVVLSTGMADMEEIKNAIKVLTDQGLSKKLITVLHCTSEYPAPFDEVNLNAMKAIREELGINVGYSDHTRGIEVPIAAVALGATIIEKHFTLDRRMEGPDHAASLEPVELTAMVSGIRNIELALGNGVKVPTESEKKNLVIVRKSIHLKNDVSKGQTLNTEDLVMLRPGDGISPMLLDQIIGRRVKSNLPAGYKLNLSDFE